MTPKARQRNFAARGAISRANGTVDSVPPDAIGRFAGSPNGGPPEPNSSAIDTGRFRPHMLEAPLHTPVPGGASRIAFSPPPMLSA